MEEIIQSIKKCRTSVTMPAQTSAPEQRLWAIEDGNVLETETPLSMATPVRVWIRVRSVSVRELPHCLCPSSGKLSCRFARGGLFLPVGQSDDEQGQDDQHSGDRHGEGEARGRDEDQAAEDGAGGAPQKIGGV